MSTDPQRPRAAVVGAGVAGLTAAHALRATHDVLLFEAEPRLGGHAHTQEVDDPAGPLAIDTGFIVHNRVTYPTLLRLFAELGVATQETEMSMSVHCRGCGLQYAGGTGGRGLTAQPLRLADPRYVRMLLDVPRFHRAARALLADETAPDLTLGEFVAAGGWSAYTVHHFVIPMVAAVWSCAPGDAMIYPARHLFAFLQNHGMLSVGGSHQWYTVTGGSRTYVERAAKELAAVHTGTPVRSVRRTGRGALVRADADREHAVDAVVVATHPDQALALLADPTPDETRLLGAFAYSVNPTILHTSTAVLPTAARARASWNYSMPTCTSDTEDVLVSYDMNRLMRLRAERTHVVSLNPAAALRSGEIDPASVLREMVYRHPVFSPAAVAAQRELGSLHDGVTAFAGAWQGWGFHEDGARSGLAAAASLGSTW